MNYAIKLHNPLAACYLNAFQINPDLERVTIPHIERDSESRAITGISPTPISTENYRRLNVPRDRQTEELFSSTTPKARPQTRISRTAIPADRYRWGYIPSRRHYIPRDTNTRESFSSEKLEVRPQDIKKIAWTDGSDQWSGVTEKSGSIFCRPRGREVLFGGSAEPKISVFHHAPNVGSLHMAFRLQNEYEANSLYDRHLLVSWNITLRQDAVNAFRRHYHLTETAPMGMLLNQVVRMSVRTDDNTASQWTFNGEERKYICPTMTRAFQADSGASLIMSAGLGSATETLEMRLESKIPCEPLSGLIAEIWNFTQGLIDKEWDRSPGEREAREIEYRQFYKKRYGWLHDSVDRSERFLMVATDKCNEINRLVFGRNREESGPYMVPNL